MNCRIACLVLACTLAGCQTPPAVRDLGTLTSKFAAQMDGSVTTYVAALNADNDTDVPRIRAELTEAARLRSEDADGAEIWRLSSGAKAADVNRLLALVSSVSAADSTPIVGGTVLSASTFAPTKITFDDAPLKTIGSVAGDLAKPQSLSDQLTVISAYATTVQGDLKSSASKLASGR